ncbi:hypothetical protein BC938DRAFT_478036 [Jimgerdemannia flammicorona]|uniref:Plant heme peroxidase family profile domain-containing protein n=1 Tax=Jimgerdemannia flammicorona TaxID=994334 RepID=A0A433QNH0_9FUNG|nr:hypothetical protein BC938DRAFT_478036 [Jimgerdemannia flammicorona]
MKKRSEYLLASLDCFDMPDSEPSDADLDSERPHATERDRLKVELAFTAEMNARTIKDAEEYYRCMLGEGVKAWNLRDTHMARTLSNILDHLSRELGEDGGGVPRQVWIATGFFYYSVCLSIWACPSVLSRVSSRGPQSHLGDARYTEMGRKHGQLNLAQLLKETYDEEVDTPPRVTPVPPAREDSYEAAFHRVGTEAGHSDFMVVFRGGGELVDAMHEEKLVERMIGVVYNTSTETTYVSTLYDHLCFPFSFFRNTYVPQ